MRPLAWTAITAAALAVALGLIARATDVGGLEMASGVLWLVAIVGAIALLPFWGRVLPTVEPMPDLFTRPGPGQRWCVECGSVSGDGACGVCGASPPKRAKTSRPPRRPRARRSRDG